MRPVLAREPEDVRSCEVDVDGVWWKSPITPSNHKTKELPHEVTVTKGILILSARRTSQAKSYFREVTVRWCYAGSSWGAPLANDAHSVGAKLGLA